MMDLNSVTIDLPPADNIYDSDGHCPHCIEKDKIIRALKLEIAQLQATQDMFKMAKGSDSSTGSSRGDRSPGGTLKQQREGLFAKRRKSISNAQWADEADDVSSWPPSFLSLWLDGKKLDQLKPLFFPDGDHPKGPMTSMFELNPHVTNTLYLVSAPPATLFDYLLLDHEDPLSKVWPHPTFVRDFALIFQYFFKPEELVGKLNSIMETESGHKLLRCGQVIHQIHGYLGNELTGFSVVNQPEHHKTDRHLLTTPNSERRGSKTSAGEKLISSLHVPDKKFLSSSSDTSPRTGHSAKKALTLSDKSDRRSKSAAQSQSTAEGSNWTPRVIAEELTLLSDEFLQSVKTTELHNRSWETPSAKTLQAWMHHSNFIGNWVSTAIICPMDIQQRVSAITDFIHLATVLLEMRNFQDLMSVVAALESSQVRKLKKTWALVHQKDVQQLESILELMNASENYKKYSEYVSDFDPTLVPVIPFINMTLHDIFMVEEKMKTFLPEKPSEVNWIKMAKVAAHIWKLRQHRQAPFGSILKSNQQVRDWIFSQLHWSDSDIQYEIAVLREKEKVVSNVEERIPRGTAPVLTQKDIATLTVGVTTTKAPKGTVIVDVGTTCQKPYLLIKGQVCLESDYQENLLIKEGHLFSTKLWTDQFESTARWVAATDIEYVMIEPQSLVEACKKLPSLYVKINRMVAHQFALSAKKSKLTRGLSTGHLKNLAKSSGQAAPAALKEWKCAKKVTVGTAAGILSVTESNYQFNGTTFGVKVKEVLKITDIKNITAKKKEVKFKLKDEEVVLTFDSKELATQVYDYVSTNWKTEVIREGITNAPTKVDDASEQSEKTGPKESGSVSMPENMTEIIWEPSKAQWEMILKGAREIPFKSGDAILTQGSSRQAGIYQIVSGTCEVQQKQGSDTKILETLQTGATFGEISFLLAREKQGASASIIAMTDDVTVRLIEGYFLDELFCYFPEIEGSFYGHLAKVLSTRIETKHE